MSIIYNTSVYNYGASELYNSARYTLSETAEVDYTVDVVEKLLYEKNLGAEYYDNSLNKYVQRFSYDRKIIKSTVVFIFGAYRKCVCAPELKNAYN